MWLKKNLFGFDIVDCDAILYMRWRRFFFEAETTHRVLGVPNGWKLYTWLKAAYYSGVTGVYEGGDRDDDLDSAIASGMNIIREALEDGTCWMYVDVKLDGFFKGLAAVDPAWRFSKEEATSGDASEIWTRDDEDEENL